MPRRGRTLMLPRRFLDEVICRKVGAPSPVIRRLTDLGYAYNGDLTTRLSQ